MDTRSGSLAEGESLPRSSLAFEGFATFDASGSLATAQVEEMVAAWRRGERPPAEEFLERHPDLGDEAVIRLIFEEICLRQEAGMEVDPLEFARRFPRLWPELEILFDCHQMIDSGSLALAMPEAGEELAEFRLLAELGRGVSGRVFLASQPTLADRPVVLKVTPRGREEHLSLARLQHMNIVPLYSAQVIPDRRLQVLCMPFLGGASLAQVLDLLKDQDPSRRTGSQLIDALDRVQASLPVALPVRGPFRRYIARSSYVEAICWVGICLADGLQYAHDRNFVHMDIKPSNVLLAGDGQPMLLDFHLAREPINPGDPPPPWIGGTPDYMAPEQAEAMAAVREGRHVAAAVDGRTDVFALGLLLHEAARGLSAPDARGSTRALLHQCNPRVSVGLSDVIHKCLCPDPRDRYANAAALAADLRRHLDDLPLEGVSNRSVSERWRKWRRRRPHSLSSTVIVLVSMMTAFAAMVLLWAEFRQRVHEVETSLAEGRAYLDRRQYAEATKSLKHGQALADHLPTLGQVRAELGVELERAQRDAKAADLHHVAELIRYRYGIDPPPAEEARALVSRGPEIWQARNTLLRPLAGRREPQVEQMIRNDLLDFALVWASFRVHSAPPSETDLARREAVDMLDEAAALLGPNPALDRDRQVYASRHGEGHLRGAGRVPASVGLGALRHGEVLPPFGRGRPGGRAVSAWTCPAAAGLLAELLPGPLRLSPQAF